MTALLAGPDQLEDLMDYVDAISRHLGDAFVHAYGALVVERNSGVADDLLDLYDDSPDTIMASGAVAAELTIALEQVLNGDRLPTDAYPSTAARDLLTSALANSITVTDTDISYGFNLT